MHLLLIEDEHELAHWLRLSLERHAQFRVEWADDGLIATHRLSVENYDAVILDLGLPSLNGTEVLRRLRTHDKRTPVLVLTARDTLNERVNLLNLGADDFLAKPFELAELEARLYALIRRAHGQHDSVLRCGVLTYDPQRQFFYIQKKPLKLSPRERAVLRVLLLRGESPISKVDIAQRVFYDNEDIHPEAIEVLIHRLRKKLAHSSVRITTHRGIGYQLECSPNASYKN